MRGNAPLAQVTSTFNTPKMTDSPNSSEMSRSDASYRKACTILNFQPMFHGEMQGVHMIRQAIRIIYSIDLLKLEQELLFPKASLVDVFAGVILIS